jgi:hypothetical protein
VTVGTDTPAGTHVLYEVQRRDGDSFQVPAQVVGATRTRVLIEFRHWTSGRAIRRSVRPYTLRLAEVTT